MMKSTRPLMWIFAIVEVVVSIWALVRGGHASQLVSDHAPSGLSCITTDVKMRVGTLIGSGIACASFALISLLAVSAYYSLGGLLMWMGKRMDAMKIGNLSSLDMTLSPTKGDESMLRIALKVLNVAVGALGIVTAALAACFFSSAAWDIDYLYWTANDYQAGARLALHDAAGLSITALIMKLLEALLGHLWAIALSNGRDKMTCMRDQALVRNVPLVNRQ